MIFSDSFSLGFLSSLSAASTGLLSLLPFADGVSWFWLRGESSGAHLPGMVFKVYVRFRECMHLKDSA